MNPWLVVALLSIGGDCITSHIAQQKPGVTETNPLLPKEPTGLEQTIACAVGIGATLFVGEKLLKRKPTLRTIFYIGLSIEELYQTGNNLAIIGVKIPL